MLNKRLKSFQYAFSGIADLFRTQANARIHLLLSVIAIGLGFYFSLSLMEWIIITFCIGLVLTAEAFNTALEYLTDLVSPSHHPLAGKTKDLAAAAVLITAIMAAIIGILVFLPKFLALLK